MSKKTLYLLGIFLTIVIGSFLYYIYNNNASTTENEKHNTTKESTSLKVTKNPFLITDGTFKVETLENFNFKKSNFSIAKPISTNISDALEKLKDYLLNNPSKYLDISGMYTSKEKNTSNLENLGLARANSIKDYLVSIGISADRINIKSELNDAFIADENDKLFGPLAFNLTGLEGPKKTQLTDSESKGESNSSQSEVEENSKKEADKKIKETSFTFYFEAGESSLKLTKEEKQKIIDISNTAKSLGLKISIIGHTDNIGSRTFNNELGKKRADFLKSQLLKNNYKKQIEISSQGEDNPVATNSTEEGRSKNRRTTIKIN